MGHQYRWFSRLFHHGMQPKFARHEIKKIEPTLKVLRQLQMASVLNFRHFSHSKF
jgi:hypothetical protein